MPKRVMITAKMLRAKGAYADQVEIFRKMWPGGATVTKGNALKAAKLGLNDEWFARYLLPTKLHNEYDAKLKPLDDEYLAKLKLLDDEYWAKLKPLDDEYDAKRKPLDDEYDAKREPLDDEYDAKRWLILYPLLRQALSGHAEDGEGE